MAALDCFAGRGVVGCGVCARWHVCAGDCGADYVDYVGPLWGGGLGGGEHCVLGVLCVVRVGLVLGGCGGCWRGGWDLGFEVWSWVIYDAFVVVRVV